MDTNIHLHTTGTIYCLAYFEAMNRAYVREQRMLQGHSSKPHDKENEICGTYQQ